MLRRRQSIHARKAVVSGRVTRDFAPRRVSEAATAQRGSSADSDLAADWRWIRVALGAWWPALATGTRRAETDPDLGFRFVCAAELHFDNPAHLSLGLPAPTDRAASQ